jgi:hypothetical protein
MIRRVAGAVALCLAAGAAGALDVAATALQQAAAIAHVMEPRVIDVEGATVSDAQNDKRPECFDTPAYADRVRAEVLLQVVGAFALKRVAAVAAGAPEQAPDLPLEFAASGTSITLKDLLPSEAPLARLREAIETYRSVLTTHRAVVLAGVDDLLRFETLEPLLTPDERKKLLAAYWQKIPRFQTIPQVRKVLGDLTDCYSRVYFLEDIRIQGRSRTFANLSPLANYHLMFWMRRHSEGDASLAHMALRSLKTAIETQGDGK